MPMPCAVNAIASSPQQSGTGSYPNFPENGWHRSSRFSVSHDPRANPNRSTASYEYCEQLGTNRHCPANNTDR